MIAKPYLLFLGDVERAGRAKVAQGIAHWRPETAIGQLRLAGCAADVGLQDLTLEEGLRAGAKTLVVGVANSGGYIPKSWRPTLIEAARLGFDIASGLHDLLADDAELVSAAKQSGATLHDVRVPKGDYPVASGKKRSGNRCLVVGTDCAIGKMYTALSLHAEMVRRGVDATFRATGQTGILISGSGVPLDAVVADFASGAIETLTPDNDCEHWDVIEGQGSLFHISYSGVTLSLIHGSQPDALILAHEAGREMISSIDGYRTPSLEVLRDCALDLARVSNPNCEVAGVSINTRELSEDAALRYIREVEQRLGLPVCDPVRHGCEKLVNSILDKGKKL